jgi:hypothetical protein
MSDGHTEGWRRQNKTPDIKDAAGRDCFINDPVWCAADDCSLFKATIVDIDPVEGVIHLMTRSNSMIEVYFKPKPTTPTCNHILRD